MFRLEDLKSLSLQGSVDVRVGVRAGILHYLESGVKVALLRELGDGDTTPLHTPQHTKTFDIQ